MEICFLGQNVFKDTLAKNEYLLQQKKKKINHSFIFLLKELC